MCCLFMPRAGIMEKRLLQINFIGVNYEAGTEAREKCGVIWVLNKTGE